MPNPHRAEIELESLGQKYKLRLDTDAICNAEAELDLGFGEIITRVLQRGVNMRLARAVICAASAGVLGHDKANEMLDFANLMKVWPQVVQLVALCLPPSQEGDTANPPAVDVASDPAPGTGNDSSPTG